MSTLISKVLKNIDYNHLESIRHVLLGNIINLSETEFISFIHDIKEPIDFIIDIRSGSDVNSNSTTINSLQDFARKIINSNINLIQIFSFKLEFLLEYTNNKLPLTELDIADIELLEEDSTDPIWIKINSNLDKYKLRLK